MNGLDRRQDGVDTLRRGGVRRQRRFSFGRWGLQRDITEEISFHLDMATEDLIDQGMDRTEARALAEQRFGSIDRYRRRCLDFDTQRARAVRREELMHDIIQDLKFALRSFVHQPAYSLVAILVLALGIGATTAIFSVVNAVLLRPLPFPKPEQLVNIWEKNPERNWHKTQAAPANYLDWKEQAQSFQSMASYADWADDVILTGSGEPEHIIGNRVSGELFAVLGIQPILGRAFRPEETWATGEATVLLSHHLWRRRFAGDPGIVGQKIDVNGFPRTVIGVMPPGVNFPIQSADLWRTWGWEPANREKIWFRRAHQLRVVGRLEPGVAPSEAAAELEQIAARLEQQYPETNRLMGTGLTPLHEWVVGDTRQPLLVLLGAVGCLLLIACANVANLTLARAAVREREMAVRGAIGASRFRLVRQVMTECFGLAVLGGIAGLALAHWGTELLIHLAPREIPRLEEVGLDGKLVAFALGTIVLTTLLFGLVPALRSSRADLGQALIEGSRPGLVGPRSGRMRGLLVATEVALALMLAVGAGLLARSFSRLGAAEAGFDPHNVLTATIGVPGNRFADEAQLALFQQGVLKEIGRLPGVQSAAVARTLPLTGPGWSSDFTAEGWPAERFGIEVEHREISPDYFKTMGVPLLSGRLFSESDRSDTPFVVIINDLVAKQFFPGENPIGQRICFDRSPDKDSVWRTIVGVVGSEKQRGMGEPPRPEFFAPHTQEANNPARLVVRSAMDPAALTKTLQQAVRAHDPGLVMYDVGTMEQVMGETLARERFLLILLGVFAAVALCLATLGVYSVTAYTTRCRTQEIGIRMALGAKGLDVLRLIVRQGMAPVAIGVALGLAGSLALSRLLASLLFETAPTDPPTFAAVTALLAVVALAACLVPARRATRIEPVQALRHD